MMRVYRINKDGQGGFKAVIMPYGHDCKVVINCVKCGNYDDFWRVSANVYRGKSRYAFKAIDLSYKFGACGSPCWPDDVPEDEMSHYTGSTPAGQDIWETLFDDFGDSDMYGDLDMLRVAIQIISEDLNDPSDNGWNPYQDEMSVWASAPQNHRDVLASALSELEYSLPTFF